MAAANGAPFAALAVLAVLSLAPTSSAEDGFALADRVTAPRDARAFGVDASVGRLDGALLGKLTLLRIEPWASFSVSDAGRGIMVALPLTIAFQNDENSTAVGNLDVGGFISSRAQAPTTVIARLSLALPTASGDLSGAAANGASALTRVSDVVLAMPSTLSARSAVSLVARRRTFTFRADIGIDLPLLEQSALVDDLSRKPLGRANLAIGWRVQDATTIAFESVNVIGAASALETTGLPADSTVLNQIGVSLSWLSESSNFVVGLFSDPGNLVSTDDGFSLVAFAQLGRSGAGR